MAGRIVKKVAAYRDVAFPSEYPAREVADHEVFMSFNSDDDAALFASWWRVQGAVAFQRWMDSRPPDEES